MARELSHKGAKGMHWGVRHGPPYPLHSNQVPASMKKAGWKPGSSVKDNIKDAPYPSKERLKHDDKVIAAQIGIGLLSVGTLLSLGFGTLPATMPMIPAIRRSVENVARANHDPIQVAKDLADASPTVKTLKRETKKLSRTEAKRAKYSIQSKQVDVEKQLLVDMGRHKFDDGSDESRRRYEKSSNKYNKRYTRNIEKEKYYANKIEKQLANMKEKGYKVNSKKYRIDAMHGYQLLMRANSELPYDMAKLKYDRYEIFNQYRVYGSKKSK